MDGGRQTQVAQSNRAPEGTAETFLSQTRLAVCLSDAQHPDQPIVFANDAFLRLTGYDLDEVVGRNCRFLQGRNTDQLDVDWIRRALSDADVCAVELLNYRKDGTAFWNAVHIGPIFDDQGRLTYFYGSQWDVTDRVVARDEGIRSRRFAAELQRRVGDLFRIVTHIVGIGEENEAPRGAVGAAIGRIRAVERSSEQFVGEPGGGATELASLIRSVLEPHDARGVGLVGAKVVLPSRLLAPVGLFIHEVASIANASEKARIEWKVADQTLVLEWREAGVRTGRVGPSPEGSALVDSVLRSVEGEASYPSDAETLAVLKVPLSTVH